jgi:hypothetical protein
MKTGRSGPIGPENKHGPADYAQHNQNPTGSIPPFRLGEWPQVIGARAITDESIDKDRFNAHVYALSQASHKTRLPAGCAAAQQAVA